MQPNKSGFFVENEMGEVEEEKKKGRNGKFAFLLIYFFTA